MHFVIAHILDPAGVGHVRTALQSVAFVDGRTSAGARAAAVKDNTQAHHAGAAPMREFVCDALIKNQVFNLAAQPKTIIGPVFSHTISGQSYGRHVDEPIMAGQRADLAFTLFLSDADAYDGGELVIEGTGGEEAVKLPAGSVFVYPANMLHRVSPVTRGERLAAVGWVRSYVRRADHREILFDLGTVLHRHMTHVASRDDVDLLSKSIANLTRLWCDD